MSDDQSVADTTSRPSRRARLGAVVLVAGAALVTAGVWALTPSQFDLARVSAFIEAAGPTAPLVFTLVQAAQVVFAPVPGQALAGVGGYLFGAFFGTVYAMAGVALGSTITFGLSRRYGRPFITRVLTPETIRRFDSFIASHGETGLFIAFLFPAFPDDALCVLAGMSTVRYRRFLLILLLGRTPTFVAAAAAGTSLAAGNRTRVLLIAVGLAGISVATYRYRSTLLSVLEARTAGG